MIDEFSDVIFDLILEVAFNWRTDGSDPLIPTNIRQLFCQSLYCLRDSIYDSWYRWKVHRYNQQQTAIDRVRRLRNIFRAKLRQRQAQLESVKEQLADAEKYRRRDEQQQQQKQQVDDTLTSIARLASAGSR